MVEVFQLTVESTLVGMPGKEVDHLTLDMKGIVEDVKHYGETRIADSRKRADFPRPQKGTIDDNWRMFSAISIEDLLIIQTGYERKYGDRVGQIEPRWIGPNIVFSGMKNFSKLPENTILAFENGAALIVTSENKSCSTPGKLIARFLDLPVDEANYFVQVADGFRGIVGKIHQPGIISKGMIAKVLVLLDN